MWQKESIIAQKENHLACPLERCLFVFGLESSGTRFVSRELAGLVARLRSLKHDSHEQQMWNGEIPPCWKSCASGTAIQHISLPWGSTCTKARARFEQNVDMCSDSRRPKHKRFIANITSMLLSNPTCTGIIVTRTEWFRRASVMGARGNHCTDIELVLKEEKMAMQSIGEAMVRTKTQLTVMEYEWLGTSLAQHAWREVVKLMRLNGTNWTVVDEWAEESRARFANGNVAYIRQLHESAQALAHNLRFTDGARK